MIAGQMMGVIVDSSTPRYPRIKLVCSGCASFGIGFPALPEPGEVTVNTLLASAMEHLARSHPDMLALPLLPALTAGEEEKPSGDDDAEQRAEAARTVG